MSKLTPPEEEIMNYLWQIESGYMKDIVDQFPDPKPAYTTIATLITRMIDKGYIGFAQHGKVRKYFPLLKKGDYFESHFNKLIKNFFNNSTSQFASFFTAKADLSVDQLEELKKIIESQIEKKKK